MLLLLLCKYLLNKNNTSLMYLTNEKIKNLDKYWLVGTNLG